MNAKTNSAARLIALPGDRVQLADVGGKALRLHGLRKLNIPVPGWITLTTAFSDLVLEPVSAQIARLVAAVPHGDAHAAHNAERETAGLIRGLTWPAGLRCQLENQVARLSPDRLFAVRSSAVGEDDARHSYAGQLRTILGVRREDIVSSIERCWAGAFAERAILYRQAHGIPAAPAKLAVIIQEMVDAAVSGIAYTADPVSGAPEHVIVAGYGLGEGVVSDRVESDMYRSAHGSASWRATVVTKTRQLALRTAATGGSECSAVAEALRDRPALTSEQLDRIARLAERIEGAAGAPQDIEWAYSGDGELAILQARPITALPEGDLAIWDDSNIGESYPGITLPLTSSFVRFAYGRVFTRALRQAGLSRAALKRIAPACEHLVGTIRGRLYLNVINYYRLFLAVPGMERSVRSWELALGITEYFDLTMLTNGAARTIGSRSLVLRTWACLAWRFLKRGSAVRRFKRSVDQMERHYGALDLSHSAPDELFDLFRQIAEERLEDWTLLVFNDIFAFRFDERLVHFCRARAGDEGDGLHQRLISHSTGRRCVAPLESLVALTKLARQHAGIATLISSDQPAHVVWDQLAQRSDASEFLQQAREHLRRHGERTVEELKLETRTPGEDPALLVAQLRGIWELSAGVGKLDGQATQAAERELRRLVGANPVRRLTARWLLAETRRGIAIREELSHARARIHGILRRLFRALGSALVRSHALDRPSDVHYLTLTELDAYLGGGHPEGNLQPLVARRMRAHKRFASESLPRRIVCRGPVYGAAGPQGESTDRGGSSDGGILRGVPCAPGVVRGRARVVSAPTPGMSARGDILVAPSTEPGWMFVMLGAKGLVVERGSILSHAAIVGRELGIPTVVGVADATSRIANRAEIELDGGTGVVRVSPTRTEATPRP